MQGIFRSFFICNKIKFLGLSEQLTDYWCWQCHGKVVIFLQVPLGKSPLAETEFWRDRSSSLSSLYEQLHSVKAKRMLSVLEAGSSNSNLLGTFKAQASLQIMNPVLHNFNLTWYFEYSFFGAFLEIMVLAWLGLATFLSFWTILSVAGFWVIKDVSWS